MDILKSKMWLYIYIYICLLWHLLDGITTHLKRNLQKNITLLLYCLLKL
uniref:Uncharacterized protein n=1 Tax=viral metagenome TaxID=1070528 RepID=A0A6C0BZN7_9ZZZZ